ncbi:hypothetical protein Ddye_023532 [Dipteronia dyeriana]|uniref:Transposase n=1 Tax=Dipteronia dyeriana TaxID=168575 RepID=A0AAD9TT65_9ROSI|nr:hypothetical protein Ddye_023532 [Dipteronia dyeriana]
MEGSSASGPKTLENSSSIGKRKISKGIRVGDRKGKKSHNVGYILKNMSVKRGRKELDANPTQKVLVKQPPLSGFGSSLEVLKFDQLKCKRALEEMLILDELSFRFVENRGFRRFFFELCPLFDLPSRRTIVRELYQLYIDEKIKLKKYFNRSKKRILSFSQIVDHKGDSIGKCIENVLIEWGIDKFFTITVDNATANTTAIGYVIRKLNSWQDDGAVLGGKYLHSGDGLKDLHDSIVAIRIVVKFVKSSPSRLERFKKVVAHEKIGTKGLVVLDVPTRWNSTYLMLESAVKLRKAFERLGEEDIQYVNYFRDDENDHKRIGIMPSASLRVTSNIYFKSWCTIRNQLNSLTTERDLLVSKIALSMQQKFDKYWGGLEKPNNLLILAVVLDPRYKLGYVKFRFDSIFGVEESESMISKLKGVLLDLYEWYNRFYGSSGGGTKQTDDVFSFGVGGGPNDDIEISRLKATKRIVCGGMKQQEEDINKGKSEVDLYLLERAEKLNERFDVLAWWKNSLLKFPILSMVARDVFAMPVSTVASESAFSTGGRIQNS